MKSVMILKSIWNVKIMVICHDLKEGDVLRCPDCGLEITVTKSCEENCGGNGCDESGACSEDDFKCCGKSMEKVE
jgi:hypothetical protein